MSDDKDEKAKAIIGEMARDEALWSGADTITVITKSGAHFEERGEAGAYVRLEDVAELVKAAKRAHQEAKYTADHRVSTETCSALEEALKPFIREA